MSGAAGDLFTRSTKRMKYIRHSSRRTARGGVSQVRGMGGRSGSGRCFAFHLGAMHDAARVLIERVAAVHGAAVIPQHEITRTPYVVPRELFTRCVGP